MERRHAENALIHICLYPFLSAASEYVESLEITLDDLISSAAFELARLRGRDRVVEAIKEGEIKIKNLLIMSSSQAEMELLSYPFARILVSCIGDEYLVQRYALSEAKTAHKNIVEGFISGLNPDILYDMASEFGIKANLFPLMSGHGSIEMHFIDYLQLTSSFKGKEWKLVNRVMEKGHVKLGMEEFSRILQESIYERVKKGLPLDAPSYICEATKRYTEDIKKLLEERKKKISKAGFGFSPGSGLYRGVIDTSSFPSCISHILNSLKEGLNVSHAARFAATAFLLNIGVKEEDVMDMYRGSPDFDEERTRYQVSHIAGSKGAETRYTAPSCATMRTYGICAGNDEVCEKVTHPLSYYKLKLKMKRKS